MVAIQIRDVPDDVREALMLEAARRHQSLQVFLTDILTRAADSAKNLALLEQWESEPPIGQDQPGDTPSIIRDGRREREQQIRAALGLSSDDGVVE